MTKENTEPASGQMEAEQTDGKKKALFLKSHELRIEFEIECRMSRLKSFTSKAAALLLLVVSSLLGDGLVSHDYVALL